VTELASRKAKIATTNVCQEDFFAKRVETAFPKITNVMELATIVLIMR
jgi:hypothetical protein